MQVLAGRLNDKYVTVHVKTHEADYQHRLWGTLASQGNGLYRPTSLLHVPEQITVMASELVMGAATASEDDEVSEEA